MARQKVASQAAPSAAGDATGSRHAEVEVAQASGKDVRGVVQTSSKRAKWPWILLIVLAILVGVFVLADHLARQYAERKVVAELEHVFDNSSVTRVDAKLGGWPFLFSVVDKNLKNGHIEFDNLRGTLSGAPVHVVTGSVDFEELHPINDLQTATVGTLTATATLDWDTLNAQLNGVRVSHLQDNRLQAVMTVQVFGVPIDIRVSGEVRLENAEGSLSLISPHAEIAGIDVPDSIVNGVVAQVQDQLRLPAIAGIRYKSVGVSAAGASVSVIGDDIKLSELK